MAPPKVYVEVPYVTPVPVGNVRKTVGFSQFVNVHVPTRTMRVEDPLVHVQRTTGEDAPNAVLTLVLRIDPSVAVKVLPPVPAYPMKGAADVPN